MRKRSVDHRIAADISHDCLCAEEGLPFAVAGTVTGVIHEKLNPKQALKLDILLPQENRDAYEKQVPLRMNGRIARYWSSEDNYYYGIEFVEIANSERGKLKRCFDFFNKNAEYA